MTIHFPDGITAEAFMRDFWQQRPLLMRGAMATDAFPLSPEELAGLACEEDIESRLIIEDRDLPWRVRHGPFDAADFKQLPESHWTLLVQDVDKFIPEVAGLLDAFDFVPQWQIDDIMISYASDQGGVGPHTDAYDVFLMQGLGRRRWRISQDRYSDDDLLPGLEQRILGRFRTDHEWLLEPGDVLYLPPGVAHWGLAEGDCMTYSLGFRSPDQAELAADWFQHLVTFADPQRRVAPDCRRRTGQAGELTSNQADAVTELLNALPSLRSETFHCWLGEHLTEPKPQFQILPPEIDWSPHELDQHIATDGGLARHPWARLCWHKLDGQRLALFINGEHLILPLMQQALIGDLCRRRMLDPVWLRRCLADDPGASELLLRLLNIGILEPAGDG